MVRQACMALSLCHTVPWCPLTAPRIYLTGTCTRAPSLQRSRQMPAAAMRSACSAGTTWWQHSSLRAHSISGLGTRRACGNRARRAARAAKCLTACSSSLSWFCMVQARALSSCFNKLLCALWATLPHNSLRSVQTVAAVLRGASRLPGWSVLAYLSMVNQRTTARQILHMSTGVTPLVNCRAGPGAAAVLCGGAYSGAGGLARRRAPGGRRRVGCDLLVGDALRPPAAKLARALPGAVRPWFSGKL